MIKIIEIILRIERIVVQTAIDESPGDVSA